MIIQKYLETPNKKFYVRLSDLEDQKLGIVKEGCTAIVGCDVDLEMARSRCEEVGARLVNQVYTNEEDFMDEINDLVRLTSESVKERVDYTRGVGEAVKSMPMCRYQSVHLSSGRVRRVVLDVGHNAHAIGRLLMTIQRDTEKGKRFRVVFGCKDSKDVGSIIEVFHLYAGIIDKLYVADVVVQSFVKKEGGGGLLDRVVHINDGFAGERIDVCGKMCSAVEHLDNILHDDSVDSSVEGVLIVGSFHMMSGVYRYLNLAADFDELDMNDTYRIK